MKGIDLLAEYRCPGWDDYPNIDLYMDQVLTFLNLYLEPIHLLNKEKKLTSSMVNNYVKHGIVEKPVKKKYSKTHLAYLYVVCLLKKTYSMEEISTLIKIQVKTSDIENAYIRFCEEMEKAIDQRFKDDKNLHVSVSADEPLRLMQETINSVVSSLYVHAIIFDRQQDQNRTNG